MQILKQIYPSLLMEERLEEMNMREGIEKLMIMPVF